MTRIDAALLIIRIAVGLTILAHAYNHAFGPGGLDGTARWFGSLGMKQPKLQAVLSAAVEAGAAVGFGLGLLTPVMAGGLVGVMCVAGWTAHRPNGFFVFRDGYEYVLFLAVVCVAVAVSGPGQASLDRAFGIDDNVGGWLGLVVVLVLAVGGAVGQLLTFYRPVRPAAAATDGGTV